MVGSLSLLDLYAATPPSVDLVIERRGEEIRIRAGVRRDVRG